MDAAERFCDDGSDFVSNKQGEGGVAHETDAAASATANATGRKQRYDTSEEQKTKREKAIEIGKSISPTAHAPHEHCKRIGAEEETKKAYQDSLQLERAAAKRVAEIAQAA